MTLTPDATLFLLLVGIAIAYSLACFGLGVWVGRSAGKEYRPPKSEVMRRLAKMKAIAKKKQKPSEQYEDAWHKAQTEPQPERIPTMEVE